MKIFNIALPTNLDMLFSYGIDDELLDENLIGRRVLVPFGKANKLITGFVIQENENYNLDAELKKVVKILDDEPLFTDKFLEFAEWMSGYYLCGIGEVLKAAIPTGMTIESNVKIKLSIDLNSIDFNEIGLKGNRRIEILKELENYTGFVNVSSLEKKLKIKISKTQIDFLVEKNLIEIENSISEDVKPKFVKTVAIADEYLEDEELLSKVFTKLEKSSPKQYKLLLFIYSLMTERKKPILISEAVHKTKSSISVLNSLRKKNLITVSDIEINRYFYDSENMLAKRDESKLMLTFEQENALIKINNAVNNNEFKTFMLFGVTGSGKTLVYIHAIINAIAKNKTAMLLVPEISLTPQLIDRFNMVFPQQIAVLHSKMTDGERFDEWRSIKNGTKKIVIGARSGIFAPLQNLGLIIVDEEHENSYKQDAPDPRYHGRDSAIMRGMIENAVVVLGSATPSIESLYNAKAGKFELLEIKGRADGAKLPKIKIVDMVDARKNHQVINSFSKELLDMIVDRMNKKEAVILFRNRRGFANYLQCNECGAVPECKNCSIKLTYHKSINNLKCHFCGYSTIAYKRCPECGNDSFRIAGYGTQRIEEELAEYLNSVNINAVIDRIDLDSTKKRGEQRKILQKFANGETDILIGTQMVAKGLDFDRVTLVGVINADLQLYISDFRASERTFQLLTQVSGRAGRHKDYAGEVIIQTSHPTNYVFKYAGQSDYDNFYLTELDIRRKANYPPFSRFVFIEIKGSKDEDVEHYGFKFYNIIAEINKSLIIYKPVLPVVFKVMNYYRRIIIVKSPKRKSATAELIELLKKSHSEFLKIYPNSNVTIKIDIDSNQGV